MSLGLSQQKPDIDTKAGQLALTLRTTLDGIASFAAWLATITDDDLSLLGYQTGEIAILRSAYGDLADLAAVAAGGESAHLTGTYTYLQFAKLLTGCQ